jgi:hypothetical protein
MSAMGPRYSRDYFINAHPGNLLIGCRVLWDLLYGLFVFTDGDVALHALGRVRKSHELARLGISVTLLAFQTERQMLLVTVRDGLLRRRVRAWIVRHHVPCGRVRAGTGGFVRRRLPGRRLFRGATRRNAKQYEQRRNNEH